MEATIEQKFLPFIIFLISGMSVASHPKIFYISLPAMAVCFHFFYPGSWVVQVALLVIWGLFLAGTYRVQAFSLGEISENKPLFIGLITLSAIAMALLLIWWNPPLTWDIEDFLIVILWMALGTAWFYHIFTIPIIMHVVVPLFVKRKTTVNTTLEDYCKIAKGSNARIKVWHSYIRFKDDQRMYEVSFFGFRRYRNKVGVPFSYIRCKCLFGLHYIYAVRQLSQAPGLPSRWESSPTTKIENKIKKYVTIFAIVTIVLALIVVGVAVLYKDQISRIGY